MHNQLFSVCVPLMLMILAPVFQVVLSTLSVKRKIKMRLWVINTLAVAFGFTFPVFATIISMMALPVGVRCATGCFGFVVLGWLIGIITVPVIGIISNLKLHANQKVILRG